LQPTGYHEGPLLSIRITTDHFSAAIATLQYTRREDIAALSFAARQNRNEVGGIHRVPCSETIRQSFHARKMGDLPDCLPLVVFYAIATQQTAVVLPEGPNWIRIPTAEGRDISGPDVFARLGGDELAALALEASGRDEAAIVACIRGN
jgi:hypothetical protein